MATINAPTSTLTPVSVPNRRHTSAIQNELLLASLTKFFSKPGPLKVLLGIINGTSNLSLRLIDWFVTNYSKKHNTIIIKQSKGRESDDYINVYINYRSQLRAFSKHLFDPFRRQVKIMFYDVHTTIGQLNFFRWAIENDVITYIQAHHDAIMQDMNCVTPTVRKTTKKTIKLATATVLPITASTSSPTSTAVAFNKRTTDSNAASAVNLAKGRRLLRFD